MKIARVAWAAVAAVVVAAGCSAGADPAPAVSGTPRTVETTSTTEAPETTTTTEVPDEPGTLLDAEQLESPNIVGTVWSVRYRSTSVGGKAVEVTGMVARPEGDAPDGGFPVLTWAHGTTGVADDCAPSARGPGAIAGLQGFLDAGYVVAATDYEGLGSPGVHPYLVSDSEGRSVLDAARAARFLVEDTTDEVAIVGHSQGGHAALAAAEIADDWAPDLDVVGTVAIAPAADLEQIVPAMFSLPVPFRFGVLVAAGWADAYDDLAEADVLGPAGMALAELARQDACVGQLFASAVDSELTDLVVARPEDLEAWSARIAENTVHPDRLDSPVLLTQGSDDVVIPAFLTDQLAERLCAAGTPLVYIRYDDADHGTVLVPTFDEMQEWLDDRLAGEPVETTC